MAKEEVGFKYRAKNKIEEAFREMKSQLALLSNKTRKSESARQCLCASLFIKKHHRVIVTEIKSSNDCK